jgi:hypothetical protein
MGIATWFSPKIDIDISTRSCFDINAIITRFLAGLHGQRYSILTDQGLIKSRP